MSESQRDESKDLHLLLASQRAIIRHSGAIATHERYYYTYIVASRSLTLYIGMTGDLDKRIFQHKNKLYEGFSADYNCNRLVWFERYAHTGSAIARESQLKGWARAKKLALIKKMNPTWVDLSEAWYTPEQLMGAQS